MSAGAAKIITAISKRSKSQEEGSGILLGTVKSLSPLVVKFDGIEFDVNNLFVNSLLLEHKRVGDIHTSLEMFPDADIDFKNLLAVGDRIIGAAVGGSSFVILCKVVKV